MGFAALFRSPKLDAAAWSSLRRHYALLHRPWGAIIRPTLHVPETLWARQQSLRDAGLSRASHGGLSELFRECRRGKRVLAGWVRTRRGPWGLRLFGTGF